MRYAVKDRPVEEFDHVGPVGVGDAVEKRTKPTAVVRLGAFERTLVLEALHENLLSAVIDALVVHRQPPLVIVVVAVDLGRVAPPAAGHAISTADERVS